MTKQDILIQILQKLVTHRPLLEGFLAIAQNPDATDDEINEIFAIIRTQLESITQTEKSTMITSVLSYLDQLKSRENDERQQEEAELDQLLQSIECL